MLGANQTDIDSGKILLHLNRIDRKLDFIIDHIKKQNTSTYYSSREVDNHFLSYFPMEDISTLQKVEEILIDEENKSKLVCTQIQLLFYGYCKYYILLMNVNKLNL